MPLPYRFLRKKNFSGEIKYIPKSRLVQEIPLYLKADDIVLGLGAGDISSLMGEIIDEFRENKSKAKC